MIVSDIAGEWTPPSWFPVHYQWNPRRQSILIERSAVDTYLQVQDEV